MTNKNDDEIYVLPFIKRPDLRKNEIDILKAESDELHSWQWWIDGLDLYKDELSSDHRQIAALDLPDHFNGTQHLSDPIKIIDAFCACHDWKVYPPAWIMNYLYTQFSEYLADKIKGKESRLGEYFGESSRGNRSGVFRNLVIAPVVEWAMIEIDFLHVCFEVNKLDAIDLVALVLEVVEEKNITEHALKQGPAALKKAYNEWYKKGMSAYLVDYWSKNPPTKENKSLRLNQFPMDAFDAYIDKYPLLNECLKGC